jgi:hypothetical protein
MSTGVYTWSQTAASNASADSAINWAEGQAPSTVNDSARALMAAVAKFRDDTNGSLAGTLSAGAYSVTSNQGTGGTIPNGFMIAFRPDTTNSGAVTLSVDSSTAHPLRPYHSTDFVSGQLVANSIYTATYISANSEWIIEGFSTPFASATAMSFFQASAPAGWTQNVTYNDAILRVVSGAGAGANTGGSGLSTFASGTTGSHAVTQAELPNCSFTVTDPGHIHAISAGAGAASGGNFIALTNSGSGFNATSHTTGITVASGGSGTAHTHSMNININYVDMIICSKN